MNQTTIQPPVKVLQWLGQESGYLRLLDQTLLPNQTVYIDCRDPQSLYQAIKRLAVRGAPAIGVAAGYGLALAAQTIAGDADSEKFLADLAKQAAYLESARPTAVNLAWAIRRVLDKVNRQAGLPAAELRKIILAEARQIQAEDELMCQAIGMNACSLVAKCRGILTHCNAGALATAGIGTATAGLYVAHAQGHQFTVYCDETRPLLQGSRLTAWELMQAGLDTVLITDNMAGHVMHKNMVQMAIVGADRIAANGDTANKIGTYGVAILARHHNIPFYVAAPYSTFDLNIKTGQDIPIELRGSEEITNGFGTQTAPAGVKTFSPAFDVTPAELITGIVTDRGIIQPVNEQTIRAVLSGTTTK
jgi:methylthioribose-1-phosphate isomerase